MGAVTSKREDTLMWITNKLGTINQFEVVEPGVIILDVRDLIDGKEDRFKVMSKIMTGDHLIRNGDRVMVRCEHGICRSNGVAAGIISYQLHISVMEAYNDIVRSKVGRA